ncbi:hypothetical protein E0H75_17945 [Kribbella capetownensis]|uniref:Peptidase MA-like domain-containing protein n=1 Tax=Kribbella capetownensis TaxID=1572659 RepID=A0A4R0JUC9_9ACTN|nr:hypothetical protein [Kribbella capetownensis]TCC50157.1 hypothetical protein E0H75_17945 [Kribbella capetownensis]
MSRLTGAGEQRGAEVIDEQGDTVPLPVVPPDDHPPQPLVRKLPPAFGPIVKKVALGLAICLVAGAGYAGLRQIADAPADPNSPVAQPPQTSTTPDEAAEGVRRAVAGEAVLQKMADAVENDNRTEFLATIDPRAAEFRAAARTIFANLTNLPIGSFTLRYVSDDTGALTPDRQAELGGSESWLAQVEVSWQLAGYDTKPAREMLPVTFVSRDGTTFAASFSERFVAGQRRPIWTLGPIDVAKSEHSLVISLGSESDAKTYLSVADRAAESVSEVWGKTNWRQKVIVYLPAKQAQMEAILGAAPNTYTQIAAVTMAELDTPQVGAPVRIVANPKLFEELGKQGRRIVLTHETTHVASTATASPVPLWLAEGFADYVAFTAVPVQDESAAKELFKAIRAGDVPATLPTTQSFAASAKDLPQAYESAWLACRLIAEREGQSKLVKFYRAVHASKSSTGLADAFKSVLDMTEAEFVVEWQKYLKRLAGV